MRLFTVDQRKIFLCFRAAQLHQQQRHRRRLPRCLEVNRRRRRRHPRRHLRQVLTRRRSTRRRTRVRALASAAAERLLEEWAQRRMYGSQTLLHASQLASRNQIHAWHLNIGEMTVGVSCTRQPLLSPILLQEAAWNHFAISVFLMIRCRIQTTQSSSCTRAASATPPTSGSSKATALTTRSP